MSLTSVLEEPEMRARFRERFPLPKTRLASPMLAPPVSRRYSLTGTAFDYLLRFMIKRAFPESVSRKWIAEHALNKIRMMSGRYASVDGKLTPLTMNRPVRGQFSGARAVTYPNSISQNGDFSLTPAELFVLDGASHDAIAPAKSVIDEAKGNLESFLQSGDMADGILKSALLLATLDPIFRTGRIFSSISAGGYLGIEEDMADLRGLARAADESGLFRPRHSAYLNPSFGEASALVGGADADIVLDGILIDIKVTKKLEFTRDMYNQLLGYHALSTREGRIRIERAGIYFARHGILHTLPADELDGKAETILGWFQEHRKRAKSGRVPSTSAALAYQKRDSKDLGIDPMQNKTTICHLGRVTKITP